MCLKMVRISCYHTLSIYSSVHKYLIQTLFEAHILSPFHKTLPSSSAFVNWISVRFYKMYCILILFLRIKVRPPRIKEQFRMILINRWFNFFINNQISGILCFLFFLLFQYGDICRKGIVFIKPDFPIFFRKSPLEMNRVDKKKK